MCKSPLHDFLCALPKCEHHIHIEGALTPSLLFSLAARNHVALPADDPAFASEAAMVARYARFTSLDDFLHYYYTAMSVLVVAADFDDLAWSYLQKAHSDGVVHAEIFFDPQAHVDRGVSYSTVLAGLTAACERAQLQLKMSTELICCFLRHLPQSDAQGLFSSKEVTDSFSNGKVVGIGLDSSENNFPPELFATLYAEAGALGIKLTAHAGEEGPAKNIETAMTALKCQRIDHGIRLADDPALMDTFVFKPGESKVAPTLLTVCPLSNVFLRCVPEIKDMPIRTFLDKGIPFSINSDDPAYFGGFILDNYCAVQSAFNLSIKEWTTICGNAILGSWCDTKRKAELQELLKATVVKFATLHKEATA